MLLLLAAAGCADPGPTCDDLVRREPPSGEHGNVLVILLDEIGTDKLSGWGYHPTPPRTPNLDALIAQGVRFDRAYAEPTCSPTRASMLTGRHPSRTGIGRWIAPVGAEVELADEEITVPEMLATSGEPWSSAMVGKWHLVSFEDPDPLNHPLRQGFDHFRGLLGNPDNALVDDGETRDYQHWEYVVDGERSWSDEWLTTVQIDDALKMTRTLPEPWFVQLSTSASHAPLSRPPKATVAPTLFDGVTQDLDSELGRLLREIDLERTTVLVMGDNGTPSDAIEAPWNPNRSKGSLTDGGVRVPLFVAGFGVSAPGARSDALVGAVDVFATVADLAGVDVEDLGVPIDGHSLLPFLGGGSEGGRRCLLVEQFQQEDEHPDLGRAVFTAEAVMADTGRRTTLSAVGETPHDQGAELERRDADPELWRELSEELDTYRRTFR